VVKYLFILNDPPYGTERSYNALRLASEIVKRDETEVSVFLIGDAASCAVGGQTTPNGYYNIERMLKVILNRSGRVGVCGSCMDARGLRDEWLAPGACRSSMAQLADWTAEANQVIVF
jgi:uncharacterized protein involved in oxidation of intracellular sulfur